MRGASTLLGGVLAGAVLIGASTDVRAQSAPINAQAPDGDFTFRRIAVPPKGQGPRIDVQIDPEAQAAALRAAAWPDDPEPAATPDAALGEATAPALTGWEWFWAEVSAERADGGPANLTRALSALSGASDAPAPRLQALKDIADTFGRDILSATIGTDVSPALVLALISVESSGRAGAESSAGAKGLMQLIPATAERFGVTDSADPGDNIKGGVAYLAWLLKHFDRDPILALAGYNAGEGAVAKHDGVPPYAETRAYVPKVLNAWRVARGLCLTPPELITDGCVFAGQG